MHLGAILLNTHRTLISAPASLQLPYQGSSCAGAPTITDRVFLINCLIVCFWKQLDWRYYRVSVVLQLAILFMSFLSKILCWHMLGPQRRFSYVVTWPPRKLWKKITTAQTRSPCKVAQLEGRLSLTNMCWHSDSWCLWLRVWIVSFSLCHSVGRPSNVPS